MTDKKNQSKYRIEKIKENSRKKDIEVNEMLRTMSQEQVNEIQAEGSKLIKAKRNIEGLHQIASNRHEFYSKELNELKEEVAELEKSVNVQQQSVRMIEQENETRLIFYRDRVDNLKSKKDNLQDDDERSNYKKEVEELRNEIEHHISEQRKNLKKK